MLSAHSVLQILGHDPGHGSASRLVTVCYQHCFGWRFTQGRQGASLTPDAGLQHDRPDPGRRCGTWEWAGALIFAPRGGW